MTTENQLPALDKDFNEQIVELSPLEKEKIELYKSQINLNDTASVIQYGSVLQNQMVAFSENVLRQVRTKDLGSVGDTLAGLVTDLKTFDKVINRNRFWDFIMGLKKKILRIKIEYTKLERNVAQVQIQLEKHYQTLLKDVHVFDNLFKQNQQYYRDLSLCIHAGEEIMADVRNNSSADEQQIHRFEKKIHDLKLSRMISLQLAPQIRLVQNNSVALMEKIHSGIVNTLPLWRSQMVLALGLVHFQQALEAQRAVNDATNEMLRRNSEMLRNSSTQIAIENERSIVDIDTVRQINNDLFSILDNIIHIQEEGRQKRQAAETELRTAENELRKKITVF